MCINIDILISDNKVNFNYMLPIEFSEKDEEFYIQNVYKPFYIENSKKINLNNLNNALHNKHNTISQFYNFNNSNSIYPVFHLFTSKTRDLIEFIKTNKEMKIHATISNDEYKKLVDNLKPEEAKNLFITFENCDGYIRYEEFFNMFKELDKIINFVKRYNLSQIEQVMLIYDIIKANKYKKESDNENYNESRDLNRIINGDKIVCVGYANLINYILTSLKIKNRIVLMNYSNKRERHVRNLVFINDKKYNINGLFLLDCTWDSKKDQKYLNNYNFFLKSLNYFKQAKTESFVNPMWLELLKLDDENMVEELKKLSEVEKRKFIYSMSNETDKCISNLYLIAIQKNDLTSELIKTAQYLKQLINKKIPKEVFKNSLYKIRKIEYINGIINYDINEEIIDDICDKYYQSSSNTLILKILDLYKEPTLNKSLKESKAKNVREDILRIKLLRILKEYIGDIPNEKFIRKMKNK